VKFADDIVFGRKPVEELLGTNRTIDKILLEQKMSGPFEKEIRQYAKTIKFLYPKYHKINSINSPDLRTIKG